MSIFQNERGSLTNGDNVAELDTHPDKSNNRELTKMDQHANSESMERWISGIQGNQTTKDETCSGYTRSIVSYIGSLYNTLVPPGGHTSSIFNLASGTLGIGIVSIPSAFHTTGVVLALVLILLSGILLITSYYFLGLACELSNSHTWEELARKLFFRGADYMVAGIVIFYLAGTMIAYVISAHDLLTPFLAGENVSPFLKSNNGHRLLTAVVWLCGMLLPSLPRRVNSLRYLAIVGVSFIFLFVIAVIQQSASHHMRHIHNIKFFDSGMEAVNGLTLFLFALSAHGTGVKVHSEMKKRTGKNMAIAGSGSVLSVSVLYFLVGFFGYVDIGPSIKGSLFPYYNVLSNTFLIVVYIGVLFKICVAYALCMQTCRISVCYMFHQNVENLRFSQYATVTLILSLTTLILGVYIPSINIVFNLLGSICCGTLALMFPAFLCMYSGGWTVQNVGWAHVILAYILVIAGVLAVVVGTAMTMYGIF